MIPPTKPVSNQQIYKAYKLLQNTVLN